jgi:hypothetical protein
VTSNKLVLSILAGSLGLIVTAVTPASAEFFGCSEPHTKVSYSPGYYPQHAAPRYSRHYTPQRSRHTAFFLRRTDRRDRTAGLR